MATKTVVEKKKVTTKKKSTWVFSKMTSITYDMFDKAVEELESEWNGKEWLHRKLTSYTYDEALLVTTLTQKWDNNIDDWGMDTLITYDYDEDDNMVQTLLSVTENE